MDAEIIYDNGERFKLSDLSVEVTDFKVSSMVKQSVYEDIEGANRVDYGAEYKHRTISIPFIMKAYDLHDFAHLRNEIFAKVDSLESFYIREMRRPIRRQYEFVNFNEKPKEREGTNNQYVDGKQYQVRLVNVIEIEQRGVKGVGELVFETTESPYAQSVYTTLDLHDSGYSATAEKYGMVDNIDDEKVKYRFTENEFTVYNAGNVSIRPENMRLNIIARNVHSSGNFTIRNKTTGEEIVLQRESNGSHFRIDGMIIRLGNIMNIFRDTNRRFISLAPGDNEFEILNGTFDEINFDFKYYYK